MLSIGLSNMRTKIDSLSFPLHPAKEKRPWVRRKVKQPGSRRWHPLGQALLNSRLGMFPVEKVNNTLAET
jgi:hypothetical protein